MKKELKDAHILTTIHQFIKYTLFERGKKKNTMCDGRKTQKQIFSLNADKYC